MGHKRRQGEEKEGEKEGRKKKSKGDVVVPIREDVIIARCLGNL